MPSASPPVQPSKMAGVSKPRLDWGTHKDAIIQLYQEKTMAKMMSEMKARGFDASRRQYFNKLQQWGVRKYSRKPALSPRQSDLAREMRSLDAQTSLTTNRRSPRPSERIFFTCRAAPCGRWQLWRNDTRTGMLRHQGISTALRRSPIPGPSQHHELLCQARKLEAKMVFDLSKLDLDDPRVVSGSADASFQWYDEWGEEAGYFSLPGHPRRDPGRTSARPTERRTLAQCMPAEMVVFAKALLPIWEAFLAAGARRPGLLLGGENIQNIKQALDTLVGVFETLSLFLSPFSSRDSRETYVLSLCVLLWMMRIMEQAVGEKVVERDRLWGLIDGVEDKLIVSLVCEQSAGTSAPVGFSPQICAVNMPDLYLPGLALSDPNESTTRMLDSDVSWWEKDHSCIPRISESEGDDAEGLGLGGSVDGLLNDTSFPTGDISLGGYGLYLE
ncbi:ankyrin repeat protein [Diplodia corticola]|uniref:Ankyrin repeat protein n=1 Tax=Diplodia corticola TaxID=236234 RepID=A0A1J9RIF6_9PEZI|nr:ankyrin repeat protein [Diplodia corticola]OJD39810.1 ankyrin repeat protein [Diplodia corticola]